MKFGEKYELLESLTTGVIETFAANDKVRGERVLVHIVECPAQKPDQTAAEWALESFRRLAPEPPGPILESGKYGTQYAYVVTKPADDTALKAWVRRYELQAQETKETKVHAVRAEISSPPPAPPSALTEPAPAAGTMTQLFRDFDSLAKAKSPSVPSVPPAPRPIPSTSMPGESGLHAAMPWDPPSVKVSPPAMERAEAARPNSPMPALPDSQISPAKDSSKPGEFTNFFQGPFRGDAPSEVPSFSSQPLEPPQKKVGEFTALFGQMGAPPTAPDASPNKPVGSFTALFRDMEPPKQTFSGMPSTPAAVIAPPEPVFIPPSPQNLKPIPESPIHATPVVPASSSPPLIPTPPVPASLPAEKPVAPKSSSLPGDGATGAFMRPPGEPAPPPAEVRVGPSPYTQIISRARIAGAEEPDDQASPTAGPAANFNAPSMPKIPGIAPPPLPKIPPPPPMPKIAAPKAPAAPKIPKLDLPAPPPVSYWPLIITLTVLFFLAVILVLFFVLRH
jgi:hypothetical protein